MAIEIVDFPIKKGDFPWQNVSSPGRVHRTTNLNHGFSIEWGITTVSMDHDYWYDPPSVVICMDTPQWLHSTHMG